MADKLVLGVIDMPYGHAYGEDTIDPNITTHQVAVKLEKRYRIMHSFYEAHKVEISQDIADAYGAMISNLFNGRPLRKDQAMGQATSRIPALFHKFLDTKQLDGTMPGIPTKRSLEGISHRKKKRVHHKKGQVIVRPSFEDSLLYRNSFKAWMTEDE
jgi:hypothetical protein